MPKSTKWNCFKMKWNHHAYVLTCSYFFFLMKQKVVLVLCGSIQWNTSITVQAKTLKKSTKQLIGPVWRTKKKMQSKTRQLRFSEPFVSMINNKTSKIKRSMNAELRSSVWCVRAHAEKSTIQLKDGSEIQQSKMYSWIIYTPLKWYL